MGFVEVSNKKKLSPGEVVDLLLNNVWLDVWLLLLLLLTLKSNILIEESPLLLLACHTIISQPVGSQSPHHQLAPVEG